MSMQKMAYLYAIAVVVGVTALPFSEPTRAESNSCKEMLKSIAGFQLKKKSREATIWLRCDPYLSAILICENKSPFNTNLVMLTDAQRTEYCGKK